LPAIVRQKAKVSPAVLAQRVVRNGALEIEQGRPGGIVQNSAMIRAAQQFRPAHTRRQRIATHEPPVPRNRGVIDQIVANDPVELSVRVLRGDTLVEAVSVVRVVLLRFGLPIELRSAARYFATIADRWPVAPVEALTHSEVRRKAMIHSEFNRPGVQKPGLVSGGVARYVIG